MDIEQCYYQWYSKKGFLSNLWENSSSYSHNIEGVKLGKQKGNTGIENISVQSIFGDLLFLYLSAVSIDNKSLYKHCIYILRIRK